MIQLLLLFTICYYWKHLLIGYILLILLIETLKRI